MEYFFDLRELLIALLRRLKFIVTTTLICVIVGLLVYFLPLAIQYVTYDSNVDKVLAAPALSQEEQPYFYMASRILYVEPIYIQFDNTVVNQAPMVINAYAQFIADKDIRQTLADEFFEIAKAEDARLKQKMVDCGYAQRAILRYEYTLINFYDQLSLDFGDHIVKLYFQSGNPDFSESVVARAEELLSAKVASKVRSFKYKVTVGSQHFWLPSPEAGMRPRTSATVSVSAPAARPLLSSMLKQAVKGSALGFAAGLAISVIVVFFIGIVGLKIDNMQDLKKYPVKIIGYCITPKKKWLGFIDKLTNKLDGNITDTVDMEQCCKIALENMLVLKPEASSILLSGLANPEVLKSVTDEMNELAEKRNAGFSFNSGPCVTYSAETIAASKSSDGVILVEQASVSNKSEVSREIEHFKMLEREVIGFIFIG